LKSFLMIEKQRKKHNAAAMMMTIDWLVMGPFKKDWMVSSMINSFIFYKL